MGLLSKYHLSWVQVSSRVFYGVPQCSGTLLSCLEGTTERWKDAWIFFGWHFLLAFCAPPLSNCFQRHYHASVTCDRYKLYLQCAMYLDLLYSWCKNNRGTTDDVSKESWRRWWESWYTKYYLGSYASVGVVCWRRQSWIHRIVEKSRYAWRSVGSRACLLFVNF